MVNLDKSLEFYNKALGLKEVRRSEAEDGSYIIVFLGGGRSGHLLKLTWLRDFGKESYNLGDNEFHLALETVNFEEALKMHREMGCVCFENPEMGIYFISDPDGY